MLTLLIIVVIVGSAIFAFVKSEDFRMVVLDRLMPTETSSQAAVVTRPDYPDMTVGSFYERRRAIEEEQKRQQPVIDEVARLLAKARAGLAEDMAREIYIEGKSAIIAEIDFENKYKAVQATLKAKYNKRIVESAARQLE